MLNRSAATLLQVRYVVPLLLAACLILFLVQTVSYILADYVPIPVMDYWQVVQLWANPKTIHWSLPDLIGVIDMSVLHGRMYLPIAVSVLCYAGVWCVLAWAAYSSSGLASPARESALLLAAIVMAWKGCAGQMATPSQLGYSMLQLAAMLALAWLSKALSNAVETGDRLQILIRSMAAVVLIGVNVIAARSGIHLNGYLLSYLAMPFGQLSYGVGLGAMNIVLMATCFGIAWRRRILKSQLSVVLFGAYVFTLLSASLLSGGRTYSDSSSTLTLPTVAWALLAFALVWMFPRGVVSTLLTLAFAGFVLWGFYSSKGLIEDARLPIQNAQITSIMLRNGVFDPDQIRTIATDPALVHTLINTLRENHKSIYAHGGDKWIGQDLAHLMPGTKPIAGKITQVRPVPGGLEIIGWVDTTSLTEDHSVLFVDSVSNRILGYTRRPAAGFPMSRTPLDTPNSLAFIGYVALDKRVEISTYVRTFHGKVVQPLAGNPVRGEIPHA
jgi:hypothetical protein